MLYVSRFVSDRARDPELWATIWQAEVPATLKLIGAYNLGGDERVFIWEGETTADLQVMDSVNPIGRTKTRSGLKVKAVLDKRQYKTGQKVADREMQALQLKRHTFHGDWNYTLRPRKAR